MAKKIISLFKKAYTKLFRKQTRRTIWGQKFYSEGSLSSKGLHKGKFFMVDDSCIRSFDK